MTRKVTVKRRTDTIASLDQRCEDDGDEIHMGVVEALNEDRSDDRVPLDKLMGKADFYNREED